MASKYKNQLPFESCIVNKKFLAKTVLDCLGQVDWLSESFDLTEELAEFTGKYILNRSAYMPNFWITKPTSMARSIDMAVSDNLDLILKMAQTGPKIACSYILNPLRFRGAKFDLRFYVLVKSVEPFEVYVHESFYIRVSKNDFTMDKRRLFQYDTHFTVESKML